MKTKIKDERGYEVTLGWLQRCQRIVDNSDDSDNYREGTSPVMIKSYRDSMKRRLRILQDEVDEYERHNPNVSSVLMRKTRGYSRDLSKKVAG